MLVVRRLFVFFVEGVSITTCSLIIFFVSLFVPGGFKAFSSVCGVFSLADDKW